ncbi:hypothetical protein [Geodermatophilus sp. URMC 62]|uniref:hypothetical protein n=1 Tax=Geodermatophilus sp. URMC 62 TaxID=3423414 RepID=UPI00406D0401
MLTEGWDANTVTHILGIRAFGSQLLCEQVVGRGLRRRSYALGEDGRFEPEYANVYGIPFAFIPSDKPGPDPLPRPPAILVESLPGREHLRIEFPKLDGYRVEIPDEQLVFDPATTDRFPIGPSTVPTRTTVGDVVGGEELLTDEKARDRRRQEVAYQLAARLLRTQFTVLGDDPRPWLFRSWSASLGSGSTSASTSPPATPSATFSPRWKARRSPRKRSATPSRCR